ncbi:hypothetical protein BGZ65_001008 [Modicella reniformis]|uniref:Uncharacterized protein n=1 Tax=Modicella reniformis TaxID=1440133 RepID=A0A9P6MJZ5_9FUNG|nr:hypothetical protein BGZ65_001008 [Modicella reniformis]
MAGLAARRAIQSSRAPRKINNDAVVRLLQSKEPETLTEEEKRELKLAERRKREKEYRDAVRKAKTDLKSDDPTTVLEARTFLDTPRRRGRPGVTSNTGVNPTMETGNDVKTMGKVKMDDEPVTSSKKAASATSIPSNKSRPSSSSSSSDGGNDSSSDSDSD